jgi:hypothetical protein
LQGIAFSLEVAKSGTDKDTKSAGSLSHK